MPCDLHRDNEVSQEVGYGDYYEVEVDISPSHYMYLLLEYLLSSVQFLVPQTLMITHMLAMSASILLSLVLGSKWLFLFSCHSQTARRD